MKKLLTLALALMLVLGLAGMASAEEQPLIGISCPYNPTVGWPPFRGRLSRPPTSLA